MIYERISRSSSDFFVLNFRATSSCVIPALSRACLSNTETLKLE